MLIGFIPLSFCPVEVTVDTVYSMSAINGPSCESIIRESADRWNVFDNFQILFIGMFYKTTPNKNV